MSQVKLKLTDDFNEFSVVKGGLDSQQTHETVWAAVILLSVMDVR